MIYSTSGMPENGRDNVFIIRWDCFGCYLSVSIYSWLRAMKSAVFFDKLSQQWKPFYIVG